MVILARENIIGAWAFLIGVVLALIIGIFSVFFGMQTSTLLIGILAILGLIVGYFVSEKNVQTFLLASVSVVVVSYFGISGTVLDAAITGVDIGKIVPSILGKLLILFVPATIVVAIKTVFSLAKS